MPGWVLAALLEYAESCLLDWDREAPHSQVCSSLSGPESALLQLHGLEARKGSGVGSSSLCQIRDGSRARPSQVTHSRGGKTGESDVYSGSLGSKAHLWLGLPISKRGIMVAPAPGKYSEV